MAQRNSSIRGEQIKDAFFGAALIRNSVDNNVADVNVDNSSIEITTDALNVKALGITNAMLAGSITDDKLISDYIQTSEVDGTTIEFAGGNLNVVANGIGAAQLDETDTYDFSASGVVRVATPVGTDDAANKSYVDGLVNGLDWKNSCRVATTGNIALTGEQTIDGVLTSTDRVLVKDQTLPAENGIYVSAAGAWARATDADADAEVTANLAVFVSEGTTQADRGYTITTNDPITVGVTGITFTQFTGLGAVIAGIGLVKTGDTIDLDLDTLTAAVVDVAADSIAIADATDGVSKLESITDLITAIAGNGLVASSGILALDLNELTAAVVDVTADSVAIIDATDNSSKKETIADIITATAGNGLAATSGVLSVDLNELTTEAVFDPAADLIGMVDATDSGSDKTLWSVIATAIAGSGLTATNGVLSANAVADQISESDYVKSVQIAIASQTVMTSFSGSAAVVANSVQVYLNGLLQEEGAGNDYTIDIATGVVTFLVGLDVGDIVTLSGVLNN